MDSSEKRKTKENKILIADYKDEMSKLVKSHKKELHVRTIFLCVTLAHIGFLFRLSNFNSLHKLCLLQEYKRFLNEYRYEADAFLPQNIKLKKYSIDQTDTLLLKRTETIKIHYLAHSYGMLQKSKTLRELQILVVGMRDLRFDPAQK